IYRVGTEAGRNQRRIIVLEFATSVSAVRHDDVGSRWGSLRFPASRTVQDANDLGQSCRGASKAGQRGIGHLGLGGMKSTSGRWSTVGVERPTREEPAMSLPEIVSSEEWIRARVDLLEREKALTKARDALAAERRRLPM